MNSFFLFRYKLKKITDKKALFHAIKEAGIPIICQTDLAPSDPSCKEQEILLELSSQQLKDFLGLEIQKTSLVSYQELASDINWEEQAELFCSHFEDGYIRVPLDEKKELRLIPGNAFGDTSHPTTTLMLNTLKQYVPSQFVLDIGTGSGILACASILLGAKHVWAFEIDEKALLCAQKNIELNALEKDITLQRESGVASLENQPSCPLIVLANMITSELFVVLSVYERYFSHPGFSLFSGILKKEKEAVKKKLSRLKLKVIDEVEKEGWVCLVCAHTQRDTATT